MRKYQLVLPELTTALFACPDCGSVVWHSLRGEHDRLHEQIDGLIDTTWTHTQLLDEHADQVFHVVRSASGHTTWTPWTDGFAVGFRVHNEESGRTRYIYLNPSTEGDEDPGGDKGTTFLYVDERGNSADGMTVTWLDVLEH